MGSLRESSLLLLVPDNGRAVRAGFVEMLARVFRSLPVYATAHYSSIVGATVLRLPSHSHSGGNCPGSAVHCQFRWTQKLVAVYPPPRRYYSPVPDRTVPDS